MRFFFCTHVRLYDLPTRRPAPDRGRPPRWQLIFVFGYDPIMTGNVEEGLQDLYLSYGGPAKCIHRQNIATLTSRLFSLRSKRFRGVGEKRRTEGRDI